MDYSPIVLSADSLLEFPTFNDALDHFYGVVEEQRNRLRTEQMEAEAVRKIDAVRAEQSQRCRALEDQAALYLSYGQALDSHADLVNAAIEMVRRALEMALRWDEIEMLLEEERLRERPPALIISG